MYDYILTINNILVHFGYNNIIDIIIEFVVRHVLYMPDHSGTADRQNRHPLSLANLDLH